MQAHIIGVFILFLILGVLLDLTFRLILNACKNAQLKSRKPVL